MLRFILYFLIVTIMLSVYIIMYYYYKIKHLTIIENEEQITAELDKEDDINDNIIANIPIYLKYKN